MKRIIWGCAVVLLSAVSAFGEDYDPAKHGNPIVVTGGTVEIDGHGAVVDGSGKVRCATLGPNVTLKNFTLKNGFADFGGGALGGRLVGCRIVSCTADLGGGAYGSALTSCAISGCTAIESGAALGACTAEDCELVGNARKFSASGAASYGGIVFDSTLANCTLKGNTADFGDAAPAFGGIGAEVKLTRCTVSGNTVRAAEGVCYGLQFYHATTDGVYAEYVDGGVGTGDSGLEVLFDGSVARNYTTTLEDGSVLTISTAKASRRKGIETVAVTARLVKGGVEYAYAGGEISEGLFVTLPTARAFGAPKFTRLDFGTGTEAVDAVLGGEWLKATAVTQEVFDGAFALTPQEGRVGVAYDGQVVVDSSWGPVRYAASKLPGGLKLNAKTGEIVGVPTKAGAFRPTVTVTSALDAKLKGAMTFAFDVAAADDWAVGTFDGGSDGTQGAEGQVTFTVSKTGKVSGKWLSDGATWKLSAASYSRYEAAGARYVADLVFKGSGGSSGAVTRELTVAEDGVCGGIASNELFLAYRNNWKLEPWKSIGKRIAKAEACVFVPDGFGKEDTVSLKVAASGAVTVKGKFAKSVSASGKVSWYSVSGKAVLCPQTLPAADGSFDGAVFVYLPPKANTPLAKGLYECVRLRWTGTELDAYAK